MPTYEYRCQSCGHEFEEFQSITADPLRKCPECGRNKLVRLIGTGAGILFRGSGFYETDYRSDSYRKAAEAEKKAATGGSDKKETKSGAAAKDTKPAKAAKPAKPAKEGKSRPAAAAN